MYSLPQEIEVWYIIPAIRKFLAKELTSEHDFTLEHAGKVLGVSKSAVSQYLANKRASSIKLPAEVRKEIKVSAEIIAKDENMAVKEILRILNLIKKCKCACEVCKKYNKGILVQCGMKPTH